MKILIHGINFSPEQIGIGKYTGEMAAWLAERGHSVRVVTAPPYYPDWHVRRDYRPWRYHRECQQGVEVWRCPLWVPRSPSGIKRILHLLSFAIFSFPVMVCHTFWKPDIVIVIEPPLFCAPQALFTARLSGAKTLMHVQDFEVAAFFGLGFFSSDVLKQWVASVEGWIMRRFDLISSISNAMLKRILSFGVPEDRVLLFPNWVDTRHVRPGSAGLDLRNEWGFSNNQKILLYSGNLGKKQGLEVIIDAAEEIARMCPEAVFVIVGDGAAKESLLTGARERKLQNVVFKPLQPLERLPALLNMADIHLVIQKRGIADAVMPSKLTGILASGGFSIITADANTELGRLVLSNPGIAVLIEPENKSAFLQAVTDALASRKTGTANIVARAYAEKNLDTERVLARFEQKLIELAGK